MKLDVYEMRKRLHVIGNVDGHLAKNVNGKFINITKKEYEKLKLENIEIKEKFDRGNFELIKNQAKKLLKAIEAESCAKKLLENSSFMEIFNELYHEMQYYSSYR